jgi:hypothetical protein
MATEHDSVDTAMRYEGAGPDVPEARDDLRWNEFRQAVTGVTGSAYDITTREMAEEALRKS